MKRKRIMNKYPSVCVVCGGQFYSSKRRVAYCGKGCRNAKNKPPIKHTPKACIVCDNLFIPIRKDRVYCSRLCKQKHYAIKNRPQIRLLANRRAKTRRTETPWMRVHNRIRSAIGKELRLCGKSKPTFDLLGYSKDELIAHLESKFMFGMTWNNYGSQWHIDHVVPVSTFGLMNESKAKRCWRLDNLQPRWATNEISRRYGYFQEGNIEKGNRYVG